MYGCTFWVVSFLAPYSSLYHLSCMEVAPWQPCVCFVKAVPERSRISVKWNFMSYQQIMRTPDGSPSSQHMVFISLFNLVVREYVVSSYCFHYPYLIIMWNWVSSTYVLTIWISHLWRIHSSFAFFQWVADLSLHIFVPVYVWMSSFDHLYVENIYLIL